MAVVRALRGATTLEVDSREHLFDRVKELLHELFERNGIHPDDCVSVLFTATQDVHSAFPAEAARAFGLEDVPLMCATELEVEGSVARCVRVMLHLYTERPRDQLRHVYLEGARGLRRDLER
jgi:chorismate mutase